MNQPHPRDCPHHNSREDHRCDTLRQKRHPVGSGAMPVAQDRYSNDVNGITNQQPQPIHDENHPAPARVIRVMIQIAFLPQVAMVTEMQNPVSPTILQNWDCACRSEQAVPEWVWSEGAMHGLVRKKADAMER